MRRLLLGLLLALPALSGCFQEAAALDVVVPYPSLGDRATYEAEGALVEVARWENAHAFPQGRAKVRFSLDAGAPVIDGARAVHETFRVTTHVDEAGGFVKHSERFVSPAFQATIQGWYPLSQDQAVLSFDERGFPWLFGTSVLFGAELSRHPRHEFLLPDNLGHGREQVLAWVVKGEEEVAGARTIRLDLEGNASLAGSAWFEPGSAWPVQATLTLKDAGLAPHVRADGAYPATVTARRVEVVAGSEPVPPRQRSAAFQSDLSVDREAWDGEAPPDGDAGVFAYALADAIRDAKLLDKPLTDWLAAADDPRVYRGSYADATGPVEGTRGPSWLVQWVDRGESYYEVEVERVQSPLLPAGVPRVTLSQRAEPPRDEAHGWFAAQDVPATFVPMSEGVRVMKEVFGAPEVQLFLRSLKVPAGYSYYVDGGFEAEGGRYTVVYAPNTAFIEHATGPVSPRLVGAP